ncbi:hypothetical protein NQ318_011566 [Aromia moschata]|uniref:Methionine--tRNA ligase, mitochondrial n=1 Tax=Aromia moschata TaxID=1265417 RepID=A0AAV8Z6X3_9CUCU|nr:hypothetical protein NQ318_011566 [Aromia moschata]
MFSVQLEQRVSLKFLVKLGKMFAEVYAMLEEVYGTCKGHYQDFNFYKVADAVIATLHSANLFFETLKPWELKKNPDTLNELNVVLHLALETLRVSAILLQPLIPNICGRLLDKMGVGEGERFFGDAEKLSWANEEFRERKLTPEKLVLFKRIVTEQGGKSRQDAKKV